MSGQVVYVIESLRKLTFGQAHNNVVDLEEAISHAELLNHPKGAKLMDLLRRISHLYTANQEYETKAIRLTNEAIDLAYSIIGKKAPGLSKTAPGQMSLNFGEEQ